DQHLTRPAGDILTGLENPAAIPAAARRAEAARSEATHEDTNPIRSAGRADAFSPGFYARRGGVPRRSEGGFRAAVARGFNHLPQPGAASTGVPFEQLRLQPHGATGDRRHHGDEAAALGSGFDQPAGRSEKERTPMDVRQQSGDERG